MILKKLEETGIIPVIKLKQIDYSEKLAEALLAGDVPAAEITFRAEGADKVIKKMTDAFPEMAVGAGTVLSVEQAKRAIDAGAKFIVSPGLDEEVVQYAQANKVAVTPGCVTPTEIQKAIKLGLDVIKFFPAQAYGGIKTIKALAGPFSNIRFIPTGGIDLGNLESYIENPCIHACGGTFMVKDSILDEQNWQEVTYQCQKAREIIKKVRR